VSRLQKGIIGYEQWMLASANNNGSTSSYTRNNSSHNNDDSDDDSGKHHQSSQPLVVASSKERDRVTSNTTNKLFIGTNFVFDRRRSAVDPSYNKSDHM